MADAAPILPPTTPQDPSVANVTVAINYSLPELEQFVSHYGSGLDRGPPSGVAVHGGIGTKVPPSTPTSGLARCVSDDEIKGGSDTPKPQDSESDEQALQRRRTRRKITPKKVQREKSSVRYSMNLVPEARRNLEFLHFWRVGEQNLHERLRLRNEREAAMAAARQQRRSSLGGTTTSTESPAGEGRPHSVGDEPAPQIGPGWTIRTVARGGDRTKCKFDKYYFSPGGRRFKSMAEVNKYKHDTERETGFDVGPAMKKPSRISSRLQKKEKEDQQRVSRVNKDTANDEQAAAASCVTCKHFPFCSRAPHPPHHPSAAAAAASSGADSSKTAAALQQPFLGDESVIWVPSSRSEWDDCVDEMTAACYSAALRKYSAEAAARAAFEDGKPAAAGSNKPAGKSKAPQKPLSRAYIRDRIDIDDPIRGYQIRHRTGGWLQGFVLMTSFTTWTHYFKWDSTHPKSGMRFTGRGSEGDAAGRVGWDHDGSMSAELEQQPRSGDPNHGGVVWPTVAEISLVGALGCGEYLVRMALDDIARRDRYDYVVLQATDTSRTFYERFGFVRVGAISKYGPQAAVVGSGSGPQQHAASSGGGSAPLVGYRHWTYADESSKKLSQAYGGPSYMMALKIDRSKKDPNGPNHHCVECGRAVGKVSFLDALADCFVEEKPKILPLGGTIGRRKPASTWGAAELKPSGSGVGAGLIDLKPSAAATATTAAMSGAGQRMKPSVKSAATISGRKRTHDQEAPGGKECALPTHRSKRMRIEERVSRPVTPVMSKFEQAQANDVWLAVPPAAKDQKQSKRRPPRPRGDVPVTPQQPARRSSRGGGVTPSTARQQHQPKEKAASSAPAKRAPLRKQRIPPMYRDPKKVYYFNKVVTPKKKGNLRSTTRPYYFVLHYEEDERTIRIIPLAQRGTFIGKREGRVKWKATVVDRPTPLRGETRDEEERRYFDAMGVITVPCDEWDIVEADSVHKCAGVAEDSWDIFDD